jgi:putative transposase
MPVRLQQGIGVAKREPRGGPQIHRLRGHGKTPDGVAPWPGNAMAQGGALSSIAAYGDSFRYPDPKQIKLDQGNGRIFLPKLGWLRYRHSRDVLGEVRNVTVSGSCGKWFVSIQTQRELEEPLPTATTAIGIDVGIARFATKSDETFIDALNSFKKHQERLARYQRRMSRKVKFSKNWKKAKARVQKIHASIANARKDFLHKATTTISKNHALVWKGRKSR